MAFAASIGDPPPIPIRKSAFSESPKSRALMIVSTEGFSSTLSNIAYSVFSDFKAFITSSREPFALAE